MANTIIEQYRELKEKHPNAILLFRFGDFYETYEDCARVCAKELGITLSIREDGLAVAGFPHHALDVYLPKLVRYVNMGLSQYRRVAICDQLEDPKLTKKLVKRGITELLNS